MEENSTPSIQGSQSGALTVEKLELQPISDPGRSIGPGLRERFAAHFSGTVETKAGYIPVLVCCFTTGLTDGTVYNAYGTFVSMQTGNTIFVALGTSGQNNRPYGWARSLCSIGCFAIGCVTFARLHKLIGGARLRRTVLFSFALQTVCVVIAAIIIQSGTIDGRYPSTRDPRDVNFTELAVVALLSFQAAGQIVNSRGLGVSEVPTVVITSLVCDLVSDELLFAGLTKNGKRNRRFLGFLLTLLGAIVGGWISKATGQVGPCLWFVAALKACISLYWVGVVPLQRLIKGA
ncbi:uncharacterized protein CC84DRAFT_1234514 [Paraphaeosphaeria sporulosa]|uniref:DUF1275 domain protein n=1 Tax=Paraphaeosphaeria sporulosa TaxID=1460663 RepID=A0A177CPQ0_9PLEO|nr:uncharacterized protein CC84DRAFT_1234514 [Paraphaeosphaeria sporulosa]OAG09201.1 hypothetical protein CC84DRAFT_1234514 [Paraphaeosphaeria sporulosa]